MRARTSYLKAVSTALNTYIACCLPVSVARIVLDQDANVLCSNFNAPQSSVGGVARAAGPHAIAYGYRKRVGRHPRFSGAAFASKEVLSGSIILPYTSGV